MLSPSEQTQFIAGQSYCGSFIGDHEITFTYIIERRTQKTVWIREASSSQIERRKVHHYNGVEKIYPCGQYSMAPILSATDLTVEKSEQPENEKEDAESAPDYTVENGYTQVRSLTVNPSNLEASKSEETETENDEWVVADFANLNKNCTLSQYQEEVDSGEYRTEVCKVEKKLVLAATEWLKFTNSFMNDDSRIAGLGGDSSLAALRPVKSFSAYSEEEQALWLKHSYRCVVLVSCGQRQIVVDPQGYSYARYVGINVQSCQAPL